MAYLEIMKNGTLVQRRFIDDDKACRGCKIRLGSHGSVNATLGDTVRLGKFEIKLIDDGSLPENIQTSFPRKPGEHLLTFSEVNEKRQDVPVARDRYGKAEYPGIDGYEIIDQLGEGGMGTVWRATQLSTKRPVALKLLGNRYFTSKQAQSRFEREVSLSARLTHPNIARVYDSGLHEGIYYYVMELLEGQHLDAYVLDGDLDQRETLDLIVKVGMAVEYAHSKGIIHRDLKPSNIIVTPDGEPHVLDFGLATTLEKDPDDLTLSVSGQITGTLSYMSPEQAEGDAEAIGERSDLYSLGVILYQMLTGTLPHEMEGSRLDVLKRIAEQDIIRPRSVNHKLSRDLEAILMKSLAIKPQDRYATAGGLAMDIQNYLDGGNVKARGMNPLYLAYKWFRGNLGQILRFVSLSIACIVTVIAVRFLWIKLQNFQADLDTTTVQSQQQRVDGPEEHMASLEMKHQKDARQMIKQIEKLAYEEEWKEVLAKIRLLENDYSDTGVFLFYRNDITKWKKQAKESIRPESH
jgi:hypothetical protein